MSHKRKPVKTDVTESENVPGSHNKHCLHNEFACLTCDRLAKSKMTHIPYSNYAKKWKDLTLVDSSFYERFSWSMVRSLGDSYGFRRILSYFVSCN